MRQVDLELYKIIQLKKITQGIDSKYEYKSARRICGDSLRGTPRSPPPHFIDIVKFAASISNLVIKSYVGIINCSVGSGWTHV